MSRQRTEYRLVPLDDSFMRNKKVHDCIWIFLQRRSYIDSQHNRFIYAEHMSNTNTLYKQFLASYQNRQWDGRIPSTLNKTIANITCKPPISRRTFYDGIEIIKKEYLSIGKVVDTQCKLVDAYIFKKVNRYKLLSNQILDELINIPFSNIYKLYAYLINCYDTKNGYTFTLKELSSALGYSSKKYNKQIIEMLNQLVNKGLIKYIYITKLIKLNKPVKYMKLVSIKV